MANRKTNATKNNAQATRKNAMETYLDRAGDIARLIDTLQMELERHADQAAAEPKNWGFAGDLSAIRGLLLHAVSQMSGLDIPTIEENLAEGK